MDKRKIKRIIAREGLVIIGLILIGIGIMFISNVVPLYPQPIVKTRFDIKTARPLTDAEIAKLEKQGIAEEVRTDLLTNKSYRLSDIKRIERGRQKINNGGSFIILFGYPVYLLIRFILWAIKTLREK